MKPLFVDTGYLLALELARDQNHPAARRHWQALLDALPPLVTTSYVFDETVTFFNSRGYHAKAVEVGNNLLDSPSVQVLQVDEPLFRAGWTLFQQHRDKRYSLTDCISFAVMRQLGIDAALAFDRHFAQAGFRMLPGSVELSGGEGARNRDYSFGGPRVTDRRGTLPSRKRPIK